MAFNSTTYRMNRYREAVDVHMAKARAAKAAGDAYWTRSNVEHARICMRLFRSLRTQRQIERRIKELAIR